MNKKFILISLLIIIVLSLQAVSAYNDTDVDVLGDSEDNQILLAPSETKNFANLNDVINTAISEGKDEITLKYNYKWDGSNWQNPDLKTGINITKNLVINGNGATISGDSNNPATLFNISSGVTLTLKNLTIKNLGGLEGWGPVTPRSVIMSQGNLDITNCIFENNGASRGNGDFEYNGSVIYSNGNINIKNSEFNNNKVENSAVIYTTGTVTVVGSTFSGNQAPNSRIAKGGAIHAGKVDLIEDSYFDTNFASYGGAVYIEDSNSITTIKDSTFESHICYENGGAIYTEGKIDLIYNSVFESNFGYNGGSIYANSIEKVVDSNFHDSGFDSYQHLDSKGGAFYITGSDDLEITGCEFSGHVNQDAGAIFTCGSVTVIDSTFSENVANDNNPSKFSKGGAIYANGDVSLENVILEDNFADYGGAIYSNGTVTIKNLNTIDNNGVYVQSNSLNGGVVYAKGNVNMENVTFGENYAQIAGGAIYSESDVTFYNSNVNGSKATRDNGNGGFIYAKGNVAVENSTIASIYMKVGD